MSVIYRYTVENADGEEQEGVWEHAEVADARKEAQRIGGRLVEYEYEFADSAVVEDYTADGNTR